jgi:hypothetical protein
MIFGITHLDKNRHVNKEAFLNLVPARLSGKAGNSFIQHNIALGTSEMTVPTIEDKDRSYTVCNGVFRLFDEKHSHRLCWI